MTEPAQLVRAIGTRELTASIINVTIASSIFLMPATVAAGLGAAAPIAYLVCATLMALIALCFAAAGSRVSLTGGLVRLHRGGVRWLCGVPGRISVLGDGVSVGRVGCHGVCRFRRCVLAGAQPAACCARYCWCAVLRRSCRREYPGHQAGHQARRSDHGGQADPAARARRCGRVVAESGFPERVRCRRCRRWARSRSFCSSRSSASKSR